MSVRPELVCSTSPRCKCDTPGKTWGYSCSCSPRRVSGRAKGKPVGSPSQWRCTACKASLAKPRVRKFPAKERADGVAS